MDFKLTEDQVLLRESAREFLKSEWPSAAMRRMLDEPAAASDEIWRKIVELGWPALLVPENYGGLGLGVFDLAVLMEELGRRLVPGAFFASGVLAVLALRELANDGAKRRYLPLIAEGGVTGALAVFEPQSGWDIARLGGADSSGVVKTHVVGAAVANTIFAIVRRSGSFQLLAVKEAVVNQGKSLDPTRTTAELRFDADAAEQLGQGSEADVQRVLDMAAVALAAEMTGGAAELLDLTVEYVKSRKQFGKPVGSFQAVQHRAADIFMAVVEARAASHYAAMVADESVEDLARAASMAKIAANQAYRLCSQQAVQLHGGIGFTWEQDLHIYLKRAKACEYTLGDTDWHLDRLAAEIGI